MHSFIGTPGYLSPQARPAPVAPTRPPRSHAAAAACVLSLSDAKSASSSLLPVAQVLESGLSHRIQLHVPAPGSSSGSPVSSRRGSLESNATSATTATTTATAATTTTATTTDLGRRSSDQLGGTSPPRSRRWTTDPYHGYDGGKADSWSAGVFLATLLLREARSAFHALFSLCVFFGPRVIVASPHHPSFVVAAAPRTHQNPFANTTTPGGGAAAALLACFGWATGANGGEDTTEAHLRDLRSHWAGQPWQARLSRRGRRVYAGLSADCKSLLDTLLDTDEVTRPTLASLLGGATASSPLLQERLRRPHPWLAKTLPPPLVTRLAELRAAQAGLDAAARAVPQHQARLEGVRRDDAISDFIGQIFSCAYKERRDKARKKSFFVVPARLPTCLWLLLAAKGEGRELDCMLVVLSLRRCVARPGGRWPG